MRQAFVTGASRGMGLEITRKLLSNSFAVTGTARKSEFPETLLGNDYFEGVYADLGDGAAIQEKIKPLFKKSCPDVLVNNAGISVDAGFSVSDDEWLATWDRTFQVNLRSAALLCKWFVNAHLDSGTEGIIINIASRAAYRGDTQEYGAYAASKGGMVAFTKSMARGFSRKGIFCYSIAPGFVQTDMVEEGIKVYGEEYLTEGSAFDEITQPGEVANMVAFLAKGEVKHMSGSTFHINGGSYMI
jgi:3-oxoacyl-[acyl-carrier protein] reductase